MPEKDTHTTRALIKLNLTSFNRNIPNTYTKMLEVLQSTVELETDVDDNP